MIVYDFEEAVVVVTGANKGVGFATALRFLESGATVLFLDREAQTLDLPKQYAGKWKHYCCDVSNASVVKSTIQAIGDAYGKIDFLINNAGIQTYGTVEETTEELWDRTMNVNLKGVFLMTHHAISWMKKAAHPVVVNIASVQSFLSQPKVCAYTTSKTALLGFTRSVAVDFAPHVRSVAVCPGTIDTPMLHEAVQGAADPAALLRECDEMHLTQRVAQPVEIANLILYLCSPEAGFITGQAFRIDGGLGVKIVGS